MTASIRLRSVLHATALSLLLALGCGDDDPADASARDGGDGDASSTRSLCELGCEATLAADCDMGPASQLVCESDCERLRTGECGSEYRALMDCCEGDSVTCDAMGFPFVAACADERGAFVDCLNR